MKMMILFLLMTFLVFVAATHDKDPGKCISRQEFSNALDELRNTQDNLVKMHSDEKESHGKALRDLSKKLLSTKMELSQLKRSIDRYSEDEEQRDALQDQFKDQDPPMSTAQSKCIRESKGKVLIKCPTVIKDDFTVHGGNIFLSNGKTFETLTSKGNLLIGGKNKDFDLTEAGSHNVVIGGTNSFTSFGGFVMGEDNSIVGSQSFVGGGKQNTATGKFSSVATGFNNTASGDYSSVTAGVENTASGYYSSVSGGNENVAYGSYSSVSGGYGNKASSYYSSVSGGVGNNASGSTSSVSGGIKNEASGWYSTVIGGKENVVDQQYGVGPLNS